MVSEIFKSDYIRVSSCVPEVRPGDPDFNASSIIFLLNEASARNSQISVFPELSITGYTCADLFNQPLLIEGAAKALETIALSTVAHSTFAIVGLPRIISGNLYNCAALIGRGKILGYVAKRHIPNYGEFYEKRWFSGGENFPLQIFELPSADGVHSFKLGIEICEDLWVPSPPSTDLACGGAELIVNLSASDENIEKHSYLIDIIRNQSARCRCGYIYSSAGIGESSTDLAFCGNSIIAEQGKILAEGERFSLSPVIITADIDLGAIRSDRIKYNTFKDCTPSSEIVSTKIEFNEADNNNESLLSEQNIKLLRPISPTPFVDKERHLLDERCKEIISIQSWGLMQRLRATGCKHAVIGISGGLDSTLALLITVKAFDSLGIDRKNIVAVTMPGPGTTHRTRNNAQDLMEILGVTMREIPIGSAVKQHFSDIGHDGKTPDAAFENSQARERTQILMDLANMVGGMVIGTGDLSELALGWCTYNGDQMSMYGVNASVPKTLVKHLVGWFASQQEGSLSQTLLDIIDTPISPELLPADSSDKISQRTEDLVGPYELHDFFLYYMLRYSYSPEKIFWLAQQAFAGEYEDSAILKWLKTFYRRFFSQQFKRSAMPDGVKVGSVCLSPRGDWRMPSDISAALWLRNIDNIEKSLSKDSNIK